MKIFSSRIALLLIAPLAMSLLSSCATRPGGGGIGGRAEYNVPAYRPNNPANVRVKVSLENKMVYVMEGDRPLLVTATAIGRPGKETPKGSFRVTRKEEKKRSNTYGFWVRGDHIEPGVSTKRPPGTGWRYVGYPMAYWVEWMPAYGFHEGSVWPTPRTAGCLRLHKNVAPKFYELVRVGTPVHIADRQPEDLTIGRNQPWPSDYADEDPPMHVQITSAIFTPPRQPLLQ